MPSPQRIPHASKRQLVYPKFGNSDILEKYGVSQQKWVLAAESSTSTIRHVIHPGTISVYDRDGTPKWKRRGITPETAHRLSSAFAQLAGIDPDDVYNMLFDDIDRQTSIVAQLKDIAEQLRTRRQYQASVFIDHAVQTLEDHQASVFIDRAVQTLEDHQ